MLREALTARTTEAFNEARAGALNELTDLFPGAGWLVNAAVEPYTDANYRNIWANELRPSVRRRLEAAGNTVEDFAAWLQGVHFVRVVAAPTIVFANGYQNNKGWRVLVLGVPAAGVVVAGLASHYQSAMNQNRLAAASNLFHDHISGVCAGAEVPMVGRKVNVSDWERAGLMTEPLLSMCDVDLSDADVDAPGVWLRDVRTTTLKKTIPSFMTVMPIAVSDGFDAAIAEALGGLHVVAGALLGQ